MIFFIPVPYHYHLLCQGKVGITCGKWYNMAIYMDTEKPALKRLVRIFEEANRGIVQPEHFISVVKTIASYIKKNEEVTIDGFRKLKIEVEDLKKELHNLKQK